MGNYQELLQQQARLQVQLAEARKEEISGAVEKVRSIMNEFGLTPEDIFPGQRRRRRTSSLAGSKVAPKYRDPSTGNTWTGRGKPPKWIEGRDRSLFLIK